MICKSTKVYLRRFLWSLKFKPLALRGQSLTKSDIDFLLLEPNCCFGITSWKMNLLYIVVFFFNFYFYWLVIWSYNIRWWSVTISKSRHFSYIYLKTKLIPFIKSLQIFIYNLLDVDQNTSFFCFSRKSGIFSYF